MRFLSCSCTFFFVKAFFKVQVLTLFESRKNYLSIRSQCLDDRTKWQKNFCITSHFSKVSKQPPAPFFLWLPVHFKNTICKDCIIRILWLELEQAFRNGNIASIEGLKAKVGPSWLGVVPDQSVLYSARNLNSTI